MTRYMIAAGLLADAAAAHAEPMIQIVEDEGFVDAGTRNFFNGGFQNRDDFIDETFLSNPGSYTGSVSVPAGELGAGIDAVFSNASLISHYSNTAFSIMTATDGAVVTNDAYAEEPQNFVTAEGRVVHNGTIALNENAMVRIRVDGNVIASRPNTEWAHRVEISGGSLAPIVIGLEDSTNAASLDTILELQAGEYSWGLVNDFGQNSGFPEAEGYSWNSSLNFSFEIIPAPGAAALFGLGGLALTRRQR